MPAALAALAAALLLALGLGVAPPAARAAGPTPSPPPSTSPNGVAWYHRDAQGSVLVDVYFGWTSSCPHCTAARPFIDQLAREEPWLVVHSLSVDGDDQANLRFLVELAASVGTQIGGVPAFLFGGQLRTGFETAETTGAELRAALQAYYAEVRAAVGPAPSGSPPSAPPSPGPGTQINLPIVGPVDASGVSLPLLTVALAGLDALNPCALSVLLFLLSVLVGSRSRRRMLFIGGTFALVSGLVYFAFMAAWLNLFLLVGALRIVTVVAGAAAVIAAAINIKDYAWFRRGPSLLMPTSARLRIFGRMLDFTATTRLSAIWSGTVLVAIAANLYEALCTGGFPVIFTRVLTLQALPTPVYYAWLGAYCLVYVLPLLAIVALFTWTLGSRGVSEREARTLKLLSGLLMLGLGLLLLLAPDRLTDLAASLTVFGGAAGIWLVVVVADRLRHPPATGGVSTGPPARSGDHRQA